MCRDGCTGSTQPQAKLSGSVRRSMGRSTSTRCWRMDANSLLGMKGTETQVYLIDGEKATKLPGIAGSYAGLDPAHTADALLVRHSTVNDPHAGLSCRRSAAS